METITKASPAQGGRNSAHPVALGFSEGHHKHGCLATIIVDLNDELPGLDERLNLTEGLDFVFAVLPAVAPSVEAHREFHPQRQSR